MPVLKVMRPEQSRCGSRVWSLAQMQGRGGVEGLEDRAKRGWLETVSPYLIMSLLLMQ